jgi:hypothetical protein
MEGVVNEFDGLKGKPLLELYRAELRRLHGDEVADKSRLTYDRGWYHIGVAQRYPDGSVGYVYWPKSGLNAKRREQVIEMIERLRLREPKQKTEA